MPAAGAAAASAGVDRAAATGLAGAVVMLTGRHGKRARPLMPAPARRRLGAGVLPVVVGLFEAVGVVAAGVAVTMAGRHGGCTTGMTAPAAGRICIALMDRFINMLTLRANQA